VLNNTQDKEQGQTTHSWQKLTMNQKLKKKSLT